MEEKERELFKRIRELLYPQINDRVKRIKESLEKPKVGEDGKVTYETGYFDYQLISTYASLLSIDKLNKLTKDLYESSERLESSSNDMVKWTKVLIGLTIVLAALTVTLILRTV